MRVTFTVLFTFIISCACAQIPNGNFLDWTEQSCPHDSTQTILSWDNWSIYHTQNDKWDGLIDSSYCIGLVESGSYVVIDLDQVNIEKPLFIRNQLQEDQSILLDPDALYTADLFYGGTIGAVLNSSTSCENQICSGLILGVEIPDSTGQGTDLRVYTSSTESFEYNSGMCYASEKFEESYLTEFIIKISFDSFGEEGVRLFGVGHNRFYPFSEDFKIYTVEASQIYYQDTSYVMNLSDINNTYENTYLLMYNDTTYPSPENPAFVEVTPSPNTSTVEQIDLVLDSEESLIFQPYAFLRGGLIEGSDTLRHNYNLINDFGSFCIYTIIDFVFSGDDAYIHQGGDLNFHGARSCFMFRDGGTLKVSDGAYLQYGEGGEGILSLAERSFVEIGEGATLAIDNQLILGGEGDDFDQQVKVFLQEGGSLIFGANSKINQSRGSTGNQVLNVYMNGGIIDDHRLSSYEKSMINRIYPETDFTSEQIDPVIVFPNPVGENILGQYISMEEDLAEIEVIDITGKLIYRTEQFLFEGLNDLVITCNLQSKGIYVLNIKTRSGLRSTKFTR